MHRNPSAFDSLHNVFNSEISVILFVVSLSVADEVWTVNVNRQSKHIQAQTKHCIMAFNIDFLRMGMRGSMSLWNVLIEDRFCCVDELRLFLLRPEAGVYVGRMHFRISGYSV